MLRLALCDDDALFRRLARALLCAQDDMQVVGESCEGRGCIEQVLRDRPDAVLLDLSMPGMSGLEAIPELLEAAPGTAVIVLSGEDAGRAEPLVRRLGAAGFIPKADRGLVDTLPPRIRSLLASRPAA